MVILHQRDKFTRTPDCVLFDIDNTLYAYDPAHEAAMSCVRHKVSQMLSVNAGTFHRAFDEARHQVKQRLGHTAASHNRLLYFQRMLEIIGLGSQVMLAGDLEQTYWRAFLNKARLFEGVKEFLDDLRLLGVPCAVVTDLTAQIQFRKLVYFGLDHSFECVVTSEEAGVDKPSSVPYLLALEKLGIEAQSIWMIGDNPINDIQGARQSVGAVTLQKIHEGVTPGDGDARSDASFSSFRDLSALLARLRVDFSEQGNHQQSHAA